MIKHCGFRMVSFWLILTLLLVGVPAPQRVAARPEAPAAIPEAVAPTPAISQTSSDYGQMSLLFVENRGQIDDQVAYYLFGGDKDVYFTPQGITFALTAPLTPTTEPRPLTPDRRLRDYATHDYPTMQRWAVKLDFVDANTNVQPIGEDKAETIVSYFKGPQSEWRTGLATYRRVVYPDLWPGIDLVYYAAPNQIKYEFVVQPGADPAQIRLAYRGATSVTRAADGQLEISTPLGSFQDGAPVAYQEIGGERAPVAMTYDLAAPLPMNRLANNARAAEAASGSPLEWAWTTQPDNSSSDTTADATDVEYTFAVGAYDPTRPLILDPAFIVYSGFIGGSSWDEGHGIAVDDAGNAYITGYTLSADFPVVGGPDLTFGDYSDAFVAKVNATGTELVYAGFLGGSYFDEGHGIAIDGAGNTYITGNTLSADFPVTGGPDLTFGGGDCGYGAPCRDAFVAKLNTAGTELIYAGFLGGSSHDTGHAIAVDNTGNAYVTGHTESSNFPVVAGPDLIFNGGYGDAFVVKINVAGTGMIYAGYLGGDNDDESWDIAVDSVGNVYVTGSTQSPNFPVVGGLGLTFNGGDAFIVKINATGTELVYAVFLGGSDWDEGHGIAVDGAGNAYVTGYTQSTDFPATGGPDLTHNGNDDAFVVKVNATGMGLVYAGFLGGSKSDQGFGIAVDSVGNAYVTGRTASYNFPAMGGLDSTFNGGIYGDAFVGKVNTAGVGLVYAGYLGGSGDSDYGQGITVDGAGNAYVTGYTNSYNFPVMVGPDLTYNGDAYDTFVTKIGVTTGPLVYTGPQFPDLSANSVMIDETDRRITMGDHVHLRLPFKNTSDQPISNTIVLLTGAPTTDSSVGVRIHNGTSWGNANQLVALTPAILNPGETGIADFWIYVTNKDPLYRKSLTDNTWIKVSHDTGEWLIPISLASLSFNVSGNEALKAGSCLHNPEDPKIQNYAQYAAGANQVSTPPTNNDDPDTPEQAIKNLVRRVKAEFQGQETGADRVPDTDLLTARHKFIGACRHYADLTTGLLRALGLPARVTDATFIKPHQFWFDEIVGHAWTEVYLGEGGWRQADSTKGRAFEESIYEERGYEVKEVWADRYPLSSASTKIAQRFQCVTSCYEILKPTEDNCTICRQESSRFIWPWQQPDLTCVEDVTSRYHQTSKNPAAFRPLTTQSSDQYLRQNEALVV